MRLALLLSITSFLTLTHGLKAPEFTWEAKRTPHGSLDSSSLSERDTYQYCGTDGYEDYSCLNGLCCGDGSAAYVSCMPSDSQCCTTGLYCNAGYSCYLVSGIQTCQCTSDTCSGDTTPISASKATGSATATAGKAAKLQSLRSDTLTSNFDLNNIAKMLLKLSALTLFTAFAQGTPINHNLDLDHSLISAPHLNTRNMQGYCERFNPHLTRVVEITPTNKYHASEICSKLPFDSLTLPAVDPTTPQPQCIQQKEFHVIFELCNYDMCKPLIVEGLNNTCAHMATCWNFPEWTSAHVDWREPAAHVRLYMNGLDTEVKNLKIRCNGTEVKEGEPLVRPDGQWRHESESGFLQWVWEMISPFQEMKTARPE
ncbi:hypothetical protein G7Y89_g7662 [Cudoniella acicularis]|uniref:Uncharacterized protein n=1 Tax=Cudoniella acicularis TaxID=354080 RepID=A0A8H4RKC8_9HELO|nr:hypothetical protein G7Y89_g7662 [Cudoniella acicularis]